MSQTMDAHMVELLLDSCFEAKRITDTLPKLPKGMKPRHNYVLHAVYELQDNAVGCRVSNVSKKLGTTMPSITKLVNELADKKLIEKYQDQTDGRVILLKLTDMGYRYVKKYVLDFHSTWAENMQDLSPDQITQTVEIIRKFKEAMPKTLNKEG